MSSPDAGPEVAGIRAGQVAEFDVTLDESMVARFAELVGDDNPVHLDDGYAQEAGLGGRVVHGMLTASFVSTLVGKYLPGPGALWVAQDFEFRSPVRIGDELRIRGEVVSVHPSLEVVQVKVEAWNQRSVLVLTGTGKVRVRRPEAAQEPEVRPAGAALVTGGTGTIGRAIVRRLGERHAHVVIGFHRDATGADRIAGELRESGRGASVLALDLERTEGLAMRYEALERAVGPIDVIVHCAAAPIRPAPLLEVEWARIESDARVAARGLLELARTVAPSMIRRRTGSIVAISTEALDAAPTHGWGPYLVAKAALEAVVRSLATELGPHGIRSNLIRPGLVASDLVAEVPERARLVLAQQTPLRRLCRAEDVAAAVAYLTGPDAAFVNGETLRLTGGRIMR